MVYLRSVKGCTILDCIHDEDIGQELNVTRIIGSYRKQWGKELLRMDGSQILKIPFKYNPTGGREVRCLRKRWAL